jgi:hypothetical protein
MIELESLFSKPGAVDRRHESTNVQRTSNSRIAASGSAPLGERLSCKRWLGKCLFVKPGGGQQVGKISSVWWSELLVLTEEARGGEA